MTPGADTRIVFMATERERKFLVDKTMWLQLEKPPGKRLRQGYITCDPSKTIRIRVAEENAWLTIKGATTGFSRTEIECALPLAEAMEMLEHFAVSEISKTRYEIPFAGKIWEVDVFEGTNEGLIVAEIELESEAEYVEKPAWITAEVTADKRYYNASLSIHPYTDWKNKQEKA